MSNLAPTPTLYRHSGRFPLAAAAAIPLALLAAALLGSIYGILEFLAQLIPEAKLSFAGVIAAIAGCAFALGVSSSYLLMRLKVRSTPAAVGLAALSALVAYYFSWFTWFASFCVYFNHADQIGALVNPHYLYDYILAINEQGFFPLIDFVPKGTFLAILWLAEFLSILIGACGFARSRMIAKVFCEHCHTWGTKRHLMNLPNPSDISITQLKSDLVTDRKFDFTRGTRENRGCGGLGGGGGLGKC
jgi:hypothetical protein